MDSENTNYAEYLIELAKSGRKKSFIDLCEINLRNVFTITYRLLSNYEVARKITLHTFFRAWDKIKDYGGKDSFSNWLKNLAIGYTIDVLFRENIIADTIKVNISADNQLLESLIMSLPPEERIIFVLHDIEGYNYKEIKKIFKNKTIDEIKTDLIRSRENIMDKLIL